MQNHLCAKVFSVIKDLGQSVVLYGARVGSLTPGLAEEHLLKKLALVLSFCSQPMGVIHL